MWKPGAPPLPTHPSPAILSAALSGSPVSFAALRLSQRSDALRSQLHLLSTRSTFSEPCFRRLLLQSRSGRFLSGVENHSLTYCVFLSSTSYTHARTLSLSVSNLGSRFSCLLLLLHQVRRANTPALKHTVQDKHQNQRQNTRAGPRGCTRTSYFCIQNKRLLNWT